MAQNRHTNTKLICAAKLSLYTNRKRKRKPNDKENFHKKKSKVQFCPLIVQLRFAHLGKDNINDLFKIGREFGVLKDRLPRHFVQTSTVQEFLLVQKISKM